MIVVPAWARSTARWMVRSGCAIVPGLLSLPDGATNNVFGGGGGGEPPVVTSTKSMLGKPVAVVGLNRIVLLPAFSANVIVVVDQLSQVPVPPNGTDCTVAPLTTTLAGRPVVVPL